MLTKEANAKLAKMVQTIPPATEPHVIWAVKHHLTQFLLGLIPTDKVLSALVISCSANRENEGILSVLTWEELKMTTGKPLVRTSEYNDGDFILTGSSEL